MNENVLFLIGFVIFGVAIAATLVVTIAGEDGLESSDDNALKNDQIPPASVTELPASSQRFNATVLL